MNDVNLHYFSSFPPNILEQFLNYIIALTHLSDYFQICMPQKKKISRTPMAVLGFVSFGVIFRGSKWFSEFRGD